jgi:hypothetical protein
MLVRFNVKSVEPTKTSGGREAVKGATLKAKPGPCVVEYDCTVPCCWYTAM